MTKLIFGENYKPEKQKKQKPLNMDITSGVTPLPFQVCTKCRSVIGQGYFNISKIFPVMCQDCKDRFAKIATVKMVIGGFIEVK